MAGGSKDDTFTTPTDLFIEIFMRGCITYDKMPTARSHLSLAPLGDKGIIASGGLQAMNSLNRV